MAWARFDDNFPQHPKIVGLSDQAFRLHVSAVCYSNANLTDGVIHVSTLPILLPGRPHSAVKRKAEELVAAGAWDRADEGCYTIHDFLTYNKPRSEVLAKREQNARAGAKGGLARSLGRQNSPVPEAPLPAPDPAPDPTESSSRARADEPEIIAIYRENFGSPNGKHGELMQYADVKSSVLMMAVQEADRSKARSWWYIKRILDRWRIEGMIDDPEAIERDLSERGAAS